MIGPYFKGVYDRGTVSKLKLNNGECAIVNNGDGSAAHKFEHWLSLFRFNNVTYMFDSYGRTCDEIDKYFCKLGFVAPKHEQMEGIYSNNCGQIALSAILTMRIVNPINFFDTYKL